MKKIALATVLALAAGLAQAVEVRLEGQDADGKNGSVSQNVYEVSVKDSIGKNYAGDLTVKQYRTDGTNALANRLEAGLTRNLDIGNGFSGYTRVAVGQKFTNGAGSYGYYSVEPGVAASIAYFPGLTASLGYRFQDAFNDTHADLTRTVRAKLGYDVTKNDNVYIGFDRQRGDTEQNITKVGYIHRF